MSRSFPNPLAKIRELMGENDNKTAVIRTLEAELQQARQALKELQTSDRQAELRAEEVRRVQQAAAANAERLADLQIENLRLMEEVRRYKALAEQAQSQMQRMQAFRRARK